MADNTTLNAGSGGDVIRTDSLISEATGAEASKAQAVKILTGADGIDGGFVTKQNPFPVSDSGVSTQLDTIISQLDRILAALETDTL